MQQELVWAALALLAAAAMVCTFLPRKTQTVPHQKAHTRKAQRVDPELPHKKAQNEFLHRLLQQDDPAPPHRKAPRQKAPKIGPRIEHEFNKLFMTTSKEGKEALIRRWMARQKCSRVEAMRLAVEEWRRENR